MVNNLLMKYPISCFCIRRYIQIYNYLLKGLSSYCGRYYNSGSKVELIFIQPVSRLMFNYVYPPDFQKAQKHRLANRIFKAVDQSCEQECECCHRKIGTENVQTSCSIDPNQLSFLGPGVPLYFLYLRHIIVILLIMSVVFMGFSIYSNVVSSDCLLISECIPNAFNILSLVNKQFQMTYLSVQSYLSLMFVIGIILMFHYLRYTARKLKKDCDEVMDTPSDYAIILRRLPPDTSEKDIMTLIESRKETMDQSQLKLTQNLKVIKVVMSYNLKEYSQIKAQNMENFKQCVNENRIQSFIPKQLPDIVKTSKTSSIAIVIFEHQSTKGYFIHKPTLVQKIGQFFCTPCLPLSDFSIHDQKICIDRAPQPDDISWENSGITMYGAICRKLLFGLVDLLILILGGGVLYALQLLSQSTSNTTLQSVLTYGSSIVVIIFNEIILVILVMTTQKQRCETLTDFQNTLMVKITLFLFLNAGVFVVMVEIAVSYSTFSLSHDLCSQITLIMILNAVTPNVTLLLLTYFEPINRVLRYFIQKKYKTATQLQLNELTEGPNIDTAYRYAHVIKTLLLTALYAPVTPIVVVVSMLGLIANYFIEKFLYTRSYSLPNTVSSIIFESAVELLEYFLVAFAFGQFIVYLYFYRFEVGAMPLDWTICIFLTIAVSILNMFLPMQVINQSLFKTEDSAHSATCYSSIQHKIEVTYQMLNPAYKTDRKRQNIKDFLGVNKALGFKSKKAQSELANFFDLTTAGKIQGMNKQPLLSEGIVPDGNNKNQIAELMKSTGRTPKVQEIKKEQGRGKVQGQGEQIMTVGEMQVGRQEAMLFSDKRLDKKQKFKHTFSMWRKPEFVSTVKEKVEVVEQQKREESSEFEERPTYEYQPLSPRQKQKEEIKTYEEIEREAAKAQASAKNSQQQQKSELLSQQTGQEGQNSPSKSKPKIRGFNGWKTDKRERPQPKQVEQSKRFKFLQIKQKAKPKDSKQKFQTPMTNEPHQLLPPVTLENTSAKSFIIDPSQFNKNEQQLQQVDQTYHETFDKHSEFKNSKGSVLGENEGKREREPIYADPIKQKKATYDPLKLDQSYNAYFKEQSPEKGPLCRSNVRTYVGNSFSSLVLADELEGSPVIKVNNTSEAIV